MTGPLPKTVDVVIIGAGPSGTTAAALLHRAGHSVCVLEREVFPRFVIGESLLPRCMDLLEEAGLLERLKTRGYLEKRGAVFLRGEDCCTFDFGEQFGDGWSYTWQVPRDDFDLALAEGVQEQGVPIHFQHTVVDAQVGASPHVVVRDPGGAEHRIECRFIVDASGYGRVLARQLDLDQPSDLLHRKSVFTHVRGDVRPEGAEEGQIWIVMHEDAWIWIIPFSDGRTSVGVVGTPRFYASYPEEPEACLRAILNDDANTQARLGEAEFLFAPHVIDGYSIGVKRLYGEGYCLLGNATEFLDPVFSAGITLALESANRAAKVLTRQLKGEAADWEADFAAPLEQGIDTFRDYVGWWYDGSLPTIFFSPDPDPGIKRMVCSVLAGYAWDPNNPFVTEHRRKVPQLVRLLS